MIRNALEPVITQKMAKYLINVGRFSFGFMSWAIFYILGLWDEEMLAKFKMLKRQRCILSVKRSGCFDTNVPLDSTI